MKMLKKLSMTAVAVTVFAGSTMAAQLLSGGNIPLVNNMVGIGVITLDFSGPGTNVDCGTYIINNNSNSFDVSWDFANDGNFKKGPGELIPMTTLTVQPGVQPAGSHLGTGVEVLNPATVWGAAVKDGGDILVQAQVAGASPAPWNPSDQTDATTNYAIVMKTSWATAATKLAGLYTEVVTFSITATIN